MFAANLLLIVAGIFGCIKDEIRVSRSLTLRGRAAQSSGLALLAAGLLSALLPAFLESSGSLEDMTHSLLLSLSLIAAAFAYVGYVITQARKRLPPLREPTTAGFPATAEPPPVAAGADSVLPFLTPLRPDTEPSPFSLARLLQASGDPKAAALAQRIDATILRAAVAASESRRTNPSSTDWRRHPTLAHLPAEIPRGWRQDDPIVAALRRAALLERERALLQASGLEASPAYRAAAAASTEQAAHLRALPARWALLSPARLWAGFVPPPGTSLPDAARTAAGTDGETQLAELAHRAAAMPPGAEISDDWNQLVCWPGPESAAFLLRVCVTPASQAFTAQALALRTGAHYLNWWEWEAWLKRAAAASAQLEAAATRLIEEFREELALIWLREQPAPSHPALVAALADRASRKVALAEFLRQRGAALAADEIAQLTAHAGRSVCTPPPAAPQTETIAPPPAAQIAPAPLLPLPISPAPIQPLSAEPAPAIVSVPPPEPTRVQASLSEPPPLPVGSEPVSRAVPPPPEPAAAPDRFEKLSPPTPAAAPTAPSAPSVWDEHIRPFLAANWYIIAGLLMVVAGASLLAYFTWDKSLLVRYLFLPGLLAGFTGGLAELGLRLSRRHENLHASGAFLLGGAICLLPVNFMVLCRAAEDPHSAGFLLPALLLYAALAGFGLWRWCGAMRPELRLLLALPLLAVNLLAVLGDMPGIRETASAHRTMLVPATLTAAVLLLLAASNRFLRLVLTKELLEARIVPWFFGLTMAATTIQVSLWRHFHLHITPRPQDYALAAILAGATLLRWERRACALRDTGAAYGGESFLGYAALLLGILMAAGNEALRIVALLLVGVIWLIQAPRRPGVVHYWIGATLCLLGGAAVGMLAAFPKSADLNLLPELGLALALVAGAARAIAGRFGEERLRAVAREIQPPILLLSAIVAVLSQYSVHSAPWQTGLVLIAAALFFAVRATFENRSDWLNIAAAAAGVALPYLGCADMLRYEFHANTLALGFGLLAGIWLAAAHFLRGEIWPRSGTFVATCYGVAGIIGLGVRLVLADRPNLGAPEFAGGILLAGALGFAAWQLRSPRRALVAAGLLVVLLPLFRVPLESVPAWLHVGSGLTSATVAFGLMLGGFYLRRLGATATAPAAPPAETGTQKAAFVFLTPALAATGWLTAKALALQFQSHPTQLPFIASILLVAATLYAAAIYFRRQPAGPFLLQSSWPLLGAGIVMACEAAGYRRGGLLQPPFFWTGIALTLLLAAEWVVARTRAWATEFLVRPRLQLLAVGSLIGTGLIVAQTQASFVFSGESMKWLPLFLAAQLVWHGLRSHRHRFGAALFVLAASWLGVWLHLPASFGHLPIFLLTIFLADLALEFFARPRAFLQPLRAPFVVGATSVAPLLAMVAALSVSGIDGGLWNFIHPRADISVVLVVLLLTARAQRCAVFALPALALGYLLWLLPATAAEFYRPWRLAGLALAFVSLPFVGRVLVARWPRFLQGLNPQWPAVAAPAARQAAWLIVPGLVLAASATAAQIGLSALGSSPDSRWVQIFAPFAALGAFALAGWYWRKGAFWFVAACLLPVANAFALCVLWGHDLLQASLMPVHLGGMAAVLTIAEFALLRSQLLRADSHRDAFAEAAQWLHHGCTALAALTLVLLSVNYLVHPDLVRIAPLRFAVSGLLALGAGTYFRLAARRPENLHTADGVALESLWHVALGLALWCAALLIPPLRTPHAALYALALPAVALWATAEWFLLVRTDTDAHRITGTRFRGSAAAFAGLVLVLYVVRLPFQMLLFPATPLDLDLYHTGATATVAMGLILIRVRGLGGAPWAALLGGLALITGLYFNATWLPGLSPFDFPMAGAWTAVVAAHLLILLSSQRSPLRSFVQFIGDIDDEEWNAHRRQWGLFVTAAAHVAVVSGLLLGARAHSLETTPLLLALASVLIHQAAIGVPWARSYWGLAGLEILLGLHFDFLLPDSAPGLIPARGVVWFLLIPWLAAAISWRRLEPRVAPAAFWSAAVGLAALGAAHLWYHGPASGSGVLIAVAMLLAAMLTPVPTAAPGAATAIALALAGPLWLAYFATRWITGDGLGDFRPLLAGAAALLGSGVLVRFARASDSAETRSGRLAHEVIARCRSHNEAVARGFLIAASASLALLTLLHPGADHGSLGGMLALTFVWAVACVAWFREGHFRDGVLPYALSLLSAAGAWVILRRLLFQHFAFWTYEYDIWLSLGASIAFSAAKRLVKHERPGLSRTMTGTVWLLPVLQCVWLLSTRLGADLTLLVIGVQSMLFAWQGGGRRDSPYNAVSMLGFVSFVCLLFWAKLDLRSLQAYTIPVGLGVLGLVWLFGRQMPPSVRNSVRLVTVLIMLGSSGYYALLDDTYSLGFHVTMLVLCLALMGLGPLLRVQLYLYLGFAGFVADLTALVIQQFRALDRSVQMMGTGALLLLFGVAVVGGAVFYKTRHEAISARFAALRARRGGWE